MGVIFDPSIYCQDLVHHGVVTPPGTSNIIEHTSCVVKKSKMHGAMQFPSYVRVLNCQLQKYCLQTFVLKLILWVKKEAALKWLSPIFIVGIGNAKLFKEIFYAMQIRLWSSLFPQRVLYLKKLFSFNFENFALNRTVHWNKGFLICRSLFVFHFIVYHMWLWKFSSGKTKGEKSWLEKFNK